MVNKDIIEKTIDYILNIKGISVIKCKPSYRPHILEVLKDYAKSYGYEINTYKDKNLYHKETLATLYDPVHNTMIEFDKDFVNENNIDWNNTGKKVINIDDIFSAYNQLPTKCKDSVNLIKHTTEDSFDMMGNPSFAWSSIYEEKDNLFNVINIPSSYLVNYTDDAPSYDFLIAHESSHCRDYYKFTSQEMENYTKLKSDFSKLSDASNEERQEYYNSLSEKEMNDYKNVRSMINSDFHMNISMGGGDDGDFAQSRIDNATFLNDGVPVKVGEWSKVSDNKSSDYGAMDISEDYAEFGAMVITGYKNPSNPNSRVKFDGEWVQYEEWSKKHPYQVQYFVKDYYNEDISIEEILNG